MPKKYIILTYGCQMNVHESEKLAGILNSAGYMQALSNDEADIFVFNTCCIRESAETHILGNLGAVKKQKEKRREVKIVVCGCMPQANGAAESLKKRCPFIDLIFGTHNLHKFSEYLLLLEEKHKGETKGTRVEVFENETEICENTPILRTKGVTALVNIMYGCNNFCSYCIVPYVRGRERSRSSTNIFNDVKSLVLQGYKEITLLGQNVNSYGNDNADRNDNFAALFHKLSSIEGKFRLKFMTSHPKDLSEELVQAMANSDKASQYIHLPIQSGSDRILKCMNRKYTASDYLRKIDLIRKYMPNAGITTDIMVGFPDESKQDVLDTLAMVQKAYFDGVYTFIYSPRVGTPAAKMENQIAEAVKKERIRRLIDAQSEIAVCKAVQEVGKSYEILCTEYKQGKAVGKSINEKVIHFESEFNTMGKFMRVEVIKNKKSRLYGIIKE